jgi:hypothetical protein
MKEQELTVICEQLQIKEAEFKQKMLVLEEQLEIE